MAVPLGLHVVLDDEGGAVPDVVPRRHLRELPDLLRGAVVHALVDIGHDGLESRLGSRAGDVVTGEVLDRAHAALERVLDVDRHRHVANDRQADFPGGVDDRVEDGSAQGGVDLDEVVAGGRRVEHVGGRRFTAREGRGGGVQGRVAVHRAECGEEARSEGLSALDPFAHLEVDGAAGGVAQGGDAEHHVLAQLLGLDALEHLPRLRLDGGGVAGVGVGVHVDQAGNEELARAVDDLGVVAAARGARCADRGDEAVAYQYRVAFKHAFPGHGNDVGVLDAMFRGAGLGA